MSLFSTIGEERAALRQAQGERHLGDLPSLVEAVPFFLSGRMTFWAYMLHCNGGLLYVGHTDNLENRVGQHESGTIPGLTRDHLPVKIIWSEAFGTRIEALEAERRLKGWSKAKKLALIRGDWALISSLAQGKGKASTSSARTV